jgi:hypothetical protein
MKTHKRPFLAMVILSLSVFSLLSCSDSSTDPVGDKNGGTPASCKRTPLPPPSGPVIVVKTSMELIDAINSANSTGHTTILIEDGTYTLDIEMVINADNIAIRSLSGNRDAVVVRGQGMAGSVSELFLVMSDRFVVADMTIGWVTDHAIDFVRSGDDHVVHNVRFVDTGAMMLKVARSAADTAYADNGLVEWCEFEYTSETGPQDYISGVYAQRARNWTVRHNTFKHIRSPNATPAGYAIHFWSESIGTVVEHNTIADCDRGIGFGLGNSGHTGGIIRNNMVSTTRDVGIGLQSSVSASIYNNSLYTENYSNSIEYRFASTQFASIINNLTNASIASRDGGTGGVESNVTSAISSWFADAGNGDLHLVVADTSVVDKGQTLSAVTQDVDCESRPKGSGYDIGADEK